jgi:hypothetical protein
MGCIAAFFCIFINGWLIDILTGNRIFFYKYIAPLVEEFAKAIYIIFLIKKKKIGFLVDAAIYGFAVGAGFAFIENIYYLYEIQDSNLLLWLIRGVGTAFMHGGSTCLFAIISSFIQEKYRSSNFIIFIPGFLISSIIHSLFNQFLLPPIVTTLIQIISLTIIISLVYIQSEKGLKNWLESSFTTDVELLEFIKNGKFKHTKGGNYLYSLKEKFPGEILVDMFCYLRIYLELAIRAKGMLLLYEAEIEIPEDTRIQDKFAEMKQLEKNFGKTGKRAIAPLLHMYYRELWQIYFLKNR